MDFVSSPSTNSTNEVHTAYGVSTVSTQSSTASTQVGTASTQTSTANLSDATVYAFLANQSNGSQLVHEDLEQIYKDDLEEIDLKWQLALLSMRAKRGPRNQDSINRYQDSSRRTVHVEETPSKAMVAIDGVRFDWSYMVEDEVPTNMALINFSNFEPEFESYGPKSCEIESKNASEDIPNEIKEYPDDPLVKDRVSDNKDCLVESPVMVEIKIVFPTIAKVKVVRPKQQENPVRKTVRKRLVYGNSYAKVNYNYSAKKAHPRAHRNMAPRVVLMKTGLRPINTARPVNTAHPKTTVYSARPMSHFSKSAQSTVKRPYQQKTTLTNKSFSQKVNAAKGKFYTARPKAVNTTRPKAVNTARPSLAVVNVVRGHPQKVQEDQGYVDSGCSRHMTKNMSYLSEFKEFNIGYVTFRGGVNGGRITGKRTIKTGKLDFEDVYFIKELQFNLLTVLLKVPSKNNMYSVDIKNIVPKESLTCLVANATLDESMLWHRRLGHVNFKIINKLVKENLMRGLPTKCFENDQTCVACLKEKQHKASCKSKIQNSISQPLFMLHMDLFGPTFVSSLMHKKYGLVVTDDYSRYTWVLFLKTKDETIGILKKFITEIENLVDKKVKVTRCDNGTEFKNSVMNDFCAMKGIKREFSVARTPQQNGVAERRNRTLIEAARTMLADFKLPTTFWAQAVNIACYVQNRVFWVYNIRTRKVKENFDIRFLEDKPIIAGDGPRWLFDIDTLTKSMIYVPVVAGKNSNDFAGINDSIGAGQSSMETGSTQDYIFMPLWKDGSLLFNSSLKISDDARKKHDEVSNKESGASNVINSVFEKLNTEYPDDPKMPGLETIKTYDDSEEETDFTNLESSINVSHTPTIRIHKNHPLKQVTRSLNTSIQTKSKLKPINEQGFISAVYERKTHKDLDTCLFACFLSQIEPTRVAKALSNPAWVEAMQEELLQFKLQKGCTQEEGIDYDEFFASVARIEAIRLFLTYASFMGFMRYQMDMKSDFLYGRIKKEVYVYQPLGFEDPDHPNKVYKVVKVFYGLHQALRAWEEDGIFISQDKYVVEVLRKFNFLDVKSASTPVKQSNMVGCGEMIQYNLTTGLYALTKNPTIYVSLIEQFWQTATIRTVDNGEQEITVTVDGKEFTVTEASVRRHLQLADAYGISVLPNTKIFDQLSLMGGFSGEHIPLFPSMLSIQEAKGEDEAIYEEWDDRVERAATTAASLDTEQASGVYTPRSDEERFKQHELMGNVQQHSNDPPLSRGIKGCLRFGDYQIELRVKKLEKKKKKARTLQPMKRRLFKVRVESSAEENLDGEDPSKQRRSFYDVQVTPTQVSAQGKAHSQEDQLEDQLGVLSAAMCKLLAVGSLFFWQWEHPPLAVGTYTASGNSLLAVGMPCAFYSQHSTAEESVSAVGVSMPVSTASMVQEVNINIPSPVVVKDKGKGKMEEYEDEQTKRTKLQQEQDRLGHEAAVRLRTMVCRRDVAVVFVRHMGQCRGRQCTCFAVGREWARRWHGFWLNIGCYVISVTSTPGKAPWRIHGGIQRGGNGYSKRSSACSPKLPAQKCYVDDFRIHSGRVLGEGEQQTQVTREKIDEEFTEAENKKECADIQAMIQAGPITTKSVQRRASSNTGKHVATGSQWNKKGNQEYGSVDSQWFKDKAFLMEAKEKGVVLDAEAEAFLVDMKYTVSYAKPLAITTTIAFELSHKDAYDSNVDEEPHAAASFMANQTGPSTREGSNNDIDFHTEVQTYDNHFFDNLNHQVSQEMHRGEQLDFDVDSVIDGHDNTIPYHQYQLNNKVKSVPTDVSSVLPGGISVITILDDLSLQLAGYIKVNKEQSFANDFLKAELERYKTQVSQEMHGGEELDSDVDSAIDDHDNIIPYHQYQLNNKVKSVPNDVSSVLPGGISVITILDNLRS
nr:hypothetical protein [Tanacetum cinerariifolium]